ncbi:DNA-binding protein [Aquitalea palustris]|uniref:DNA-binding protein n=1 Tax=Aquitalea palustris TaxID=2480983 RepID=A0A454JL33_9NEIS|nr:helix-turn-helix domain-containing protein [Aquitalea palustris]RMD00146.1 DNA-binding protein [Aquitalea palustris]
MKKNLYYPPALQAHIDAGKGALTTEEAAVLLGFKPQTLRKWMCYGEGPKGLKPLKIGHAVRWPIEQLASLLQGGEHG